MPSVKIKNTNEKDFMTMKKHELTQTQWNKIKSALPAEKKPHAGRPAKDNKLMLHAMLYWLNTGIALRDLPERFGPWQSVYTRFRRWTDKGIWDKVLAEMVKHNIIDQESFVFYTTNSKTQQQDHHQ